MLQVESLKQTIKNQKIKIDVRDEQISRMQREAERGSDVAEEAIFASYDGIPSSTLQKEHSQSIIEYQVD